MHFSCSGILCGFASSAEPVSADTVCLPSCRNCPEYRNQGYGTAFLLLLLPDLAKEGFQKVLSRYPEIMLPPLHCTKKTGFSVTKTLSYYFY